MTRILSQKTCCHHHSTGVLQEFLSSGQSESASPFLTLNSKKWAKNLSLKTAIFSLALLVLAIVTSFFPQTEQLSKLTQVVLYFLAGAPALIEAVEQLKQRSINIDVLMVLAAFLSIFIHSSLEGALLLVLFSTSHSLEHYVSHKAKSTLNHLNEMAPRKAQVIHGSGKIVEKSTKDIQVGEIIWVRAGEVIPLDGKVIEGQTSMDVSHLTGEHAPMPLSEGQQASAGALNLEGSLKIQVDRTNSHSTLSKIINLIYKANNAKPKLQSWFDRFGQKYSLFVIVSSLLFALILPWINPQLSYWGIEGSIYRALAYLIAASPCALIMAVPIAYISAINASAKQGVILKGGITLDILSKIKSIAFDKTGTLTSGELECLKITSLDGMELQDPSSVLAVAKGLEQHALHPVAKAIIHYADFRGISSAQISKGKALPGQGIEGVVYQNDKELVCAIGKLSFIASMASEKQSHLLLNYQNQPGHLISALKLGDQIYLFHFVDHLRADAQRVLKDLKNNLGLKTYILSGDNDLSVARVAQNLEVDHYFGGLKPEDKLKLVEEYSKKEPLAMVGDGINDTPALARASVGIALGNIGSHMGSEISQVVLIKNDLSLIYKLLLKAKKTIRVVKQNVLLASLIIVLISIPALFGIIPLWMAVVFHEGGTVLVGVNSLRLLRK